MASSSVVRLLFAFVAALSGATCGSDATSIVHHDPGPSDATKPLVITDVDVIPMSVDSVRRAMTVIVRDGRIAFVGPRAEASIPTDAVMIDGTGRYLMPALIDMHAHLLRADVPAYVKNGVATIRNMWGTTGLPSLIADIDRGLQGPTIYSASPGVDGNPPQWPQTIVVMEPESAATVVHTLAAARWRWLKVYTQLSLPVFDSVMAAARREGITPIGHVPAAVDVRHAIEEGMRSIEHFTGYDRAVSRTRRIGTWAWIDADETRFRELAVLTARAGVWNCPTFAIYTALARQQNSGADQAAIARTRRAFLRELVRAGAPILAGSDAGIDVVAPGTSLHDELREFVAAELTPYQALRAATVDAARFLGRGDLGTIAVGSEGSLLLLRANPLRDINATRLIDGVVLRGAWIPQ
jgi:imidazolonepropionase-like amidohydrolase